MSAFSATDNQRRARFFVFKCIKIKHSFTINQHLLIHSTARTQMSSPDQSINYKLLYFTFQRDFTSTWSSWCTQKQ